MWVSEAALPTQRWSSALNMNPIPQSHLYEPAVLMQEMEAGQTLGTLHSSTSITQNRKKTLPLCTTQ